MGSVVLDTNILLENANIIDSYEDIILNSAILEELDGLKKSSEIGHKAREAIRKIEENEHKIRFIIKDVYDFPLDWDNKRDNKIVLCAKENNAKLITNDINLRLKAKALNVEVEKYLGDICGIDYKGYKVISFDESELAHWYENEVKSNKWDLTINEYLLIKDIYSDKIVDSWVWTKKGFRHISTKKIDSVALGKIKLLDEYQVCAIDSLSNNAVSMIKGAAGTGKSLLTASYAMSMIEKGKIDKLIVFTNPLATKNSARLGFYPGSKDEKLLDSQIGNMLISKFGDRMEVEQMIKNEKLLLLPFSDLRGFDSSNMKALIWITEAQNLDIDLMKLAIQRIGDDCQCVIDGDYNAQVDCYAFEGGNNGMKRVSEVFRGQDFYGEIELQNVYRSKWADWANKL